MIEKCETWQLVEKPHHRKIIGVKWAYHMKLNVDGPVNKLKAKTCEKLLAGHLQKVMNTPMNQKEKLTQDDDSDKGWWSKW